MLSFINYKTDQTAGCGNITFPLQINKLLFYCLATKLNQRLIVIGCICIKKIAELNISNKKTNISLLLLQEYINIKRTLLCKILIILWHKPVKQQK